MARTPRARRAEAPRGTTRSRASRSFPEPPARAILSASCARLRWRAACIVDANNNGALDAGETAIAGATVTLTGTDDLGHAVSLTATTGAGGGYAFNNLRPGTYTLTETQPAGYLDGKDALGTQGGTLGNDTVSGISLTEGTTGTGNTFGELQGASIAGNVYRDANNDGVLNAGENGVAGVTITLTGTDDLGQAVSLSTTTGAGGAYAFSNLRPGTYSVAETQPAGLLDGKDTAGAPGGGTAGNDLISGITLVSGRASAGNNFGELDAASISGIVYIDANNDGIFQAGETPLAGVTLTLTGTDDRGGAVSLTTTTDATGLYTFANLRPGSYTVNETQPAGLLDGKDTAGAPGGGTAGNDVITGITLIPARDSQGNSFGELRPASLGGSIWSDTNNNGVFDAGETPIAGATVTLTGTDDLGNAVSLTATTNASGAYVFNNLRPGSYALTETQPAGFLDGKDTLGTQGGTLGNDTVTGITLTEGAVGTGNNFAELTPAALSGTVYRDLNNDGVQAGAGETGIAGTTVTVTGTDDLGQAVSLSTTTDASGNYAFANLRPGTYTLTETQPAGLLDGKETAGVLGGTVDNTTTSNTISGISLTAGANGTGNLFGELPPSSLAGSVYNDANNNGTRDAGESPITGVTITLTGTDDRGNAVSLTADDRWHGCVCVRRPAPGQLCDRRSATGGLLRRERRGGHGGRHRGRATRRHDQRHHAAGGHERDRLHLRRNRQQHAFRRGVRRRQQQRPARRRRGGYRRHPGAAHRHRFPRQCGERHRDDRRHRRLRVRECRAERRHRLHVNRARAAGRLSRWKRDRGHDRRHGGQHHEFADHHRRRGARRPDLIRQSLRRDPRVGPLGRDLPRSQQRRHAGRRGRDRHLRRHGHGDRH